MSRPTRQFSRNQEIAHRRERVRVKAIRPKSELTASGRKLLKKLEVVDDED